MLNLKLTPTQESSPNDTRTLGGTHRSKDRRFRHLGGDGLPQWMAGLRGVDQGKDAFKDLFHLGGRFPFGRGNKREADAALLIDVAVVDGRDETQLWRLKGELFGAKGNLQPIRRRVIRRRRLETANMHELVEHHP